MTRALVVLVVAVLAAPARGDDEPEHPPNDQLMKEIRDAYARGDYAHARELLLEAYKLAPKPALLFALGQVEFNLKHYKAAIDYYEKFMATEPDAEQAALAQQAVGAARMQLARPEPPPRTPERPRPPPHREFDRLDSALAIGGGILIAGSGIAFYEMVHLSEDRSGTLQSYDRRESSARLARIGGIAAGALGAAAVTSAVLRWRVHWFETRLEVSPRGAVVTVEKKL